MQKRFKILMRYLKYYSQAQNYYRIHSPFVYEFSKHVLEDDRLFYAFDELEDLRKLLVQNRKTIQVTDFGAGSHVDATKTRSVSSIAKSAATSPAFCQILFRIIDLYKPKTILELGTSLGIATLYQAAAARSAEVYTIEGCPNTAGLAQANFKRMEVDNIHLKIGQFEYVLEELLPTIGRLDYAFLDGNHRKKPTIDYFERCLKCIHDDSILVFDDIHWSEEMEEAWEEVKRHPKVTLSIDLFFCGIVFFRKEQKQKEHFTLIPSRWKPSLLPSL